ncbi:hypothetical protein [uncultured Mitsuokella sp.]|uniref:hypothetical protein n=1 Tax=uncultured Mitsuokella sp. TaxID=453120 RepID=UPI0026DCC758|nr:hypothetical protein [uncultured Mitsuokella sp.]
MDDNAEVEAFWSKKGIKADDIIANFLYWSILSVQMMMGDNTIGTLGANLSQVALQAAPLFNAVYAQKVWNSGEANNEGGAS